MEPLFQEIAGLDKLIHEPARLSIMTALMACERADFIFLQRLTGLTAGNLSVHLTKLENASLITTEKRFIARRPNTIVSITKMGMKSIRDYWTQMENFRSAAQTFS